MVPSTTWVRPTKKCLPQKQGDYLIFPCLGTHGCCNGHQYNQHLISADPRRDVAMPPLAAPKTWSGPSLLFPSSFELPFGRKQESSHPACFFDSFVLEARLCSAATPCPCRSRRFRARRKGCGAACSPQDASFGPRMPAFHSTLPDTEPSLDTGQVFTARILASLPLRLGIALQRGGIWRPRDCKVALELIWLWLSKPFWDPIFLFKKTVGLGCSLGVRFGFGLLTHGHLQLALESFGVDARTQLWLSRFRFVFRLLELDLPEPLSQDKRNSNSNHQGPKRSKRHPRSKPSSHARASRGGGIHFALTDSRLQLRRDKQPWVALVPHGAMCHVISLSGSLANQWSINTSNMIWLGNPRDLSLVNLDNSWQSNWYQFALSFHPCQPWNLENNEQLPWSTVQKLPAIVPRIRVSNRLMTA